MRKAILKYLDGNRTMIEEDVTSRGLRPVAKTLSISPHTLMQYCDLRGIERKTRQHDLGQIMYDNLEAFIDAAKTPGGVEALAKDMGLRPASVRGWMGRNGFPVARKGPQGPKPKPKVTAVQVTVTSAGDGAVPLLDWMARSVRPRLVVHGGNGSGDPALFAIHMVEHDQNGEPVAYSHAELAPLDRLLRVEYDSEGRGRLVEIGVADVVVR